MAGHTAAEEAEGGGGDRKGLGQYFSIEADLGTIDAADEELSGLRVTDADGAAVAAVSNLSLHADWRVRIGEQVEEGGEAAPRNGSVFAPRHMSAISP